MLQSGFFLSEGSKRKIEIFTLGYVENQAGQGPVNNLIFT